MKQQQLKAARSLAIMAFFCLSIPAVFGILGSRAADKSTVEPAGLELRHTIQNEFARMRDAGQVRINGTGLDITSTILGFIPIGSRLDQVESLLISAGMKLGQLRAVIGHKPNEWEVYAFSETLISWNEYGVGSEVSIRLRLSSPDDMAKVVQVLAFIKTTAL